MKRRAVVSGLLHGALFFACAAPIARALGQQVRPPISRPSLPSRPGRPDRPVRPGRLGPGGVNYGAAAGVYTVVAVNERDRILRLRDDQGNAADVYVSERLFDLSSLKAGDMVAVDFFVGDDNSDRIEAATVEKLEPIPQ